MPPEPPADALDFGRAAARIGRNMIWIAAAGTVAAVAARGWSWGAGFLLGALISGLNYRWLRRVVEALGGANSAAPSSRSSAVKFALRYLLLGGGAYAILRYSRINLAGVLVGLFVLVAAVFVETAFELIYGRKRTLDHRDL
jgi:hypothetical protein